LRFRRSFIGYNKAQTDKLLEETEQSHQAAIAQKQSQLNELLTYQEHLQKQQSNLAQMLQTARVRSDVFDLFSEALQQYFGRSEQRNEQEIQYCREAAAQLQTALNQQGEKVESDIIDLETFLASVEKHLGDLVYSLGQEFEIGQELLTGYAAMIREGALAAEGHDTRYNTEKLKWTPELKTPTSVAGAEAAESAAADAEAAEPGSEDNGVGPPEGVIPEKIEADIAAPEVVIPEVLIPEVVLREVIIPEVVHQEEIYREEDSAEEPTREPLSYEVPEPEAEPVTINSEPFKTSSEVPAAKSKRVAFSTDDDSTILAILKVMLEREGFEVIQASEGREASRLINEMPPPDIAILDLMLPYIDGLQLTRQIRSKDEWAGTPILILSSNSTENEMVTLLEAGADDYVIKPFNTRELIARVKRLSEAPVK